MTKIFILNVHCNELENGVSIEIESCCICFGAFRRQNVMKMGQMIDRITALGSIQISSILRPYTYTRVLVSNDFCRQ